MGKTISRAGVAAVAALTLTAALVATTEPAAAQWRYGPGWHGGYGGWHGGGYWHPGYWRGGHWYNGWWGPAVAAGVVAGAAIATAPYWGPGYAYADPCWQVRPVYAANGVWLGNRPVNVCQ